MKKRINRQLMVISSMAVAIMLLLMTAVFYHIFRGQVMDDLRLYAYAVAESIEAEEKLGSGYFYSRRDKENERSVRATIISPEGAVLYDSNADTGDMDNHAGRPEVRDALQNGEGSSIRQSSTMKMNTYYYTLLLEDGNVLRVARESHSIWNILYSSVPAIVAAVCALLVLCMMLSRRFTKSLLQPVEQLAADMDCMENHTVYEELIPFAETIRKQHDAILDSANMRQEFSANVSHELKTPLTAISGYSELIENGMASGKDAVRFAAEIHKNAKRLLTLIDDTIRLSELDAPDLEIPMEDLNLYDIVSDSVEMMQMRAEERKVHLTVEGSDCIIRGDKQMIEELVYNLCDNAICYNNVNGTVHVSVECEDDNVVLRVKDTGIGIPETCQERVFERFYRVDKSRSKSTGGTGLGLAIVKHIVTAHHAELTLESIPGEGTDIRVIFSRI
ncbi:MAG: two-component sensor histidine kinase [Lachnospiraceae bacterium]|nr:two-component sensor histidine kinase [Lachnospiraceae bacterium]